MCLVYNAIGSLGQVESHLIKNGIYEFNSISEIIDFEKNYNFYEQQIILRHKSSVQNEKNALEEDIARLIEDISKIEIEQNKKLEERLNYLNKKVENLFFQNLKIIYILRDLGLNVILWTKIWSAPTLARINIFISNRQQSKSLSQKKIRYEYINKNFDSLVNQRSSSELRIIVRKRNLINEIKSFIYGAIGEYKVEKELRKLSDEYILINDFTCSFQPAIYNRRENDYIKSVQIDHILISPSGVFLIETKNWSEHSIKSIDSRSPVQQVKRTGFALFILLTNNKLNEHFWGERKIPIRHRLFPLP